MGCIDKLKELRAKAQRVNAIVQKAGAKSNLVLEDMLGEFADMDLLGKKKKKEK